MKLLVTGATGFIGSNLTRFLCSRGYVVRALCRPTSNINVLSDTTVQIYRGDVLDISSVKRAVDGCDYVFHLASYAKNWAKNPQAFFEVNVIGTKNVLEASKQANVKKVVVTSSCMTFGTSKGEPRKESDRRSMDFFSEYESTKSYAEEIVLEFVRNGLPVVIVNPTRVFGPGLLTEGNSVTKMIELYLQGKWRLILADGSAVGNYAFVEDVVLGHWLALQQGCLGERYILGGENLTYNAFFDTLAQISQRHNTMIHVPVWLALAFSHIEVLLARGFGIYPLITPRWISIFSADWVFSSKKAQTELGYRITSFREALQKTLVWLNR
ncbi:MAG: SDR family oxidoreductase [Candidatus Latescibacteria bacterium]|nr:SDR family oxidoreductase [Candidatus Latescibacterota bacterium]